MGWFFYTRKEMISRTRVKIFSDESNKRMFDLLVDEKTGISYIELKPPGAIPMTVRLVEFKKKVNKELGKEFIVLNTTELLASNYELPNAGVTTDYMIYLNHGKML